MTPEERNQLTHALCKDSPITEDENALIARNFNTHSVGTWLYDLANTDTTHPTIAKLAAIVRGILIELERQREYGAEMNERR